jgi:RNA polymerase sigma-70 factor (ECF subfamily)
MGSDSSRKELDAEAFQIIRRTASRLIGKAGVTSDESENIEGDLTLHVLEQLSKFDPTRGRLGAFVTRVVEHKAADILDARRTARRDFRVNVCSLSDTVRIADGEEVSLEDIAREDAVRSQHSVAELSLDEQVARKVDLERLLSQVPEEHRDLCRRLMSATISEVAAALGVPRTTLYWPLGRLRAIFEEAGLREYIQPDSSLSRGIP